MARRGRRVGSQGGAGVKLLPNSIVLPPGLRTKAVVTVNEVPAQGLPPTGHIDLSFFYHGLFQGTFGRNSQGTDIAGRFHKQSLDLTITGSMPGGIFTEANAGVTPHFVIVSEKNYFSMISYAQSQAKLTAQGKGFDYNIFSGNCSDFTYRVFQHSDLPEKFRLVDTYLKDHGKAPLFEEPVAIYSDNEKKMYGNASKNWSPARRLAERGGTMVWDTLDLKRKYMIP